MLCQGLENLQLSSMRVRANWAHGIAESHLTIGIVFLFSMFLSLMFSILFPISSSQWTNKWRQRKKSRLLTGTRNVRRTSAGSLYAAKFTELVADIFSPSCCTASTSAIRNYVCNDSVDESHYYDTSRLLTTREFDRPSNKQHCEAEYRECIDKRRQRARGRSENNPGRDCV